MNFFFSEDVENKFLVSRIVGTDENHVHKTIIYSVVNYNQKFHIENTYVIFRILLTKFGQLFSL